MNKNVFYDWKNNIKRQQKKQKLSTNGHLRNFLYKNNDS